MQPPKPSRRFSFFGLVSSGESKKIADDGVAPPSLNLQTDKEVYRPGDPVIVTVEVRNPMGTCSLLVERLSFEIKGIEKLDVQWFATPKPSMESCKQRRGEFMFMDCLMPSLVSNQILSSGATKRYVVRTILPRLIPPSYRGATIRYLYYLRISLSGQYLMLENGHRHGESTHDLPGLEARIPLQIWATQKTNGLLLEESQIDDIVPATTISLDVYWKEMDGDSDWARANETFDGAEEGYESSRDEISSISSYNPSKDNMHNAFGSSSALQSLAARTSNKEITYPEERNRISTYMPPPPRLSVAEVLYDSRGVVLSPQKPSAFLSESQRLKHANSYSTDEESQQLKHANSYSTDEELVEPSVPGTVNLVASEGFARGRSYNIRLDDQVLLRFSPKNSETTYYFSDMIGGTLTFFHEEGSRRCLELSITLEMSETINRQSVHPSRKHSPTITKVHSDHHEVVADLVQTSFLFSIPMDGPMSFSTHNVSVQWALRFEFLTTPKNLDWTRYDHPLLIDGRDKCEWVLPITVHAPPSAAAGATQFAQNQKTSSFETLWVHT